MAKVPGKVMIPSPGRPFRAPYFLPASRLILLQNLSTKSIPPSLVISSFSLRRLDLILSALSMFIIWP